MKTIKETADIFGVHWQTVRNWIRDGQIKAIKIERTVRIPDEEIGRLKRGRQMPESKKYWYIQLNVNFFDDERIDWLCEQKNGCAYVVLYLKLCLKTANNNGILTRQIGDMIIPYNIDKIAEITHINVDIVRVALELYKKIGLVYEADENCNFMRIPDVPAMVGYTTQAAIEKEKQREMKTKKE